MILLALAETDRIRGHSIINTQCTAIFIHSLPTVNYPTSPRRNSLPPSSHQNSGNIQRLFINNWKIFKDFFAWKFVLAANHQCPGIIQRLSGHQQQQPPAATSSSNQQQQPAAAINSSNQQQHQQQQPAAATTSSSQQQQSAAATSSSNQQQQPAAATSSNNQQQQSAFILPAAPSQSTPTSVSYHYGS